MNNKKNNKEKRFPDNKYRVVHEFLSNAFLNEIRFHDNTQLRKVVRHPQRKVNVYEPLARRSTDKVYKVDILNKEIHLENNVILKLCRERATSIEFIIIIDTSKVPRRIYDMKYLYTTITKEDFYLLYHAIKQSLESILFQLIL